MVFGKLKTPQVSAKKFTDFVTSDTMFVVLGAIVVTPILFAVISTFVTGKLPISQDNVMIALIIASVIMFVLSTLFSGKIRMLLVGASAGAFIQAITQTSFARNVLDRLAQATPGA